MDINIKMLDNWPELRDGQMYHVAKFDRVPFMAFRSNGRWVLDGRYQDELEKEIKFVGDMTADESVATP